MQNSIKRAEQLTKKIQSKTKKIYRKYTTKKHRHKTIITIVSLVSILLVLILAQMYLAQARRSDKVLELRQQYETKVKVESELKVELRNQLKLQKVYEKKLATKKKQLKTLKANKALERAEAEKKAQVTAPEQNTPQTAPEPVVGVTNCGDNPYKQFIYQHESGCRTNAINPLGCAGIGQACPGSKLPCSLADFACQDAYFTNYAVSRYGSWEGAYNAWLRQGWW